jgi:hypothetical protein
MAKPIEVHPVTPDRWADLEKLFGPSGGYGGCWCMYSECAPRRTRERRKRTQGRDEGSGRKRTPPGLLAYANGEPAGWVSLDARESSTT